MILKIPQKKIQRLSWPISHREYKNIIEKIIRLVLDSQNLFYKKKIRDYELFNCIQTDIAQKIFYLYQEKKIIPLIKKFNTRNKKELFGLNTKGSFEHLHLQKGLRKKNIFFRYMRLLKNFYINNVYSYKIFEKIKKKELNVVVSNNHLIKQYLRKNNKKFYLCPLYEWFYPCSEKEYKLNRKKFNMVLINFFLKKVRTFFSESHCKLRQNDLNAIKKFMIQQFFWINLYLSRLDKIKNKVPKILLTGSLGIIWCRLLATAVKKDGGKVFTFDHCMGDISTWYSSKLFSDANISDIFFTFNKKHIEYHSIFLKKNLSDFSKVKIKSISNKKINYLKDKNFIKKKKILLITPPFLLNQGLSITFLPPLVLIEWHLNLINHIKSLGFDLTYKPHPDTDKKLVKEICKISNIEYDFQILEKIYQNYDYLFFDYRSTNAWSFALRTNKPIILNNFKFFSLKKEDNLKLKKRASIIDIKINKLNKPSIKKSILNKAIINSKKIRNDKTFLQLMYS